MRAVIQRCGHGKVSVAGRTTGEVGAGFVVLLGVGEGDTDSDAAYLAEKTAYLRVFTDEDGKMNLSLLDLSPQGQVLVVSQFTLYGDCRKGRRPSYAHAAAPEEANRLYQAYVEHLRGYGLKVETGEFQAAMVVELANDGPVTLLVDTRKEF